VGYIWKTANGVNQISPSKSVNDFYVVFDFRQVNTDDIGGKVEFWTFAITLQIFHYFGLLPRTT